MALFTLSFFTFSAQPSPEQISYDLLQQLCHTCSIALSVAIGVGFLLVVTLLFLGAAYSAASVADCS